MAYHSSNRQKALFDIIDRTSEKPNLDNQKNFDVLKQYGENVFNIQLSRDIPGNIAQNILDCVRLKKPLDKEMAEYVAKAVTKWAVSKGVTHFCHWFQPLTGSTAEKHDSFINFSNGVIIQKLSASQLMQGEPDASSFPSGGLRTTFEARGYTSWDVSSPMFIMETDAGKTLCIPTAFVTYHGESMDIKTPLIKSLKFLDQEATKFLNSIRKEKKHHVDQVITTCGSEQEYFLVDKTFYYMRPDLVMCDRTLIGSLTSRNQQLEDHYFGTIQERVLEFMQILEKELYRLGIPAKTRHNEVAPGQFEMAPIFEEANISADHNQLVMATIKKVANRQGFVAILHEKPFASVNGSGKHMNWSMEDTLGVNLLDPGDNPSTNRRFLAMLSIVVEAVKRHSGMLRCAISGHGNDHRLGANEAPPSIISVFLGSELGKLVEQIIAGEKLTSSEETMLEIGSHLTNLKKDNTDRNRTSPFAFTGNKFEVRAVGSSQAIGFPMTILNAAVAEVLKDTNVEMEKLLSSGKSIEESLNEVTRKWFKSSQSVIFNGDNYDQSWVDEAQKRGLPNYRNTSSALEVLKDDSQVKFLIENKIMSQNEINVRYNVLLERYIKHRQIEFETLFNLVDQYVVPSVISYKKDLVKVLNGQKDCGVSSLSELEILKKLSFLQDSLYNSSRNLESAVKESEKLSEKDFAEKIANDYMLELEKVSGLCNALEEILPDKYWSLPKYLDMLFIR